ncbi:hypothetical protein [Pedococcus soli]
MTHSSTTTSPGPTRDSDDESPTTSGAIPGGHWLATNPLRSAFLVITVLALAIRLSVLKDSYFITDDFMLSARAMENPLSWEYLTRVHTGHFEPIGFATMWLLAHFAPLSWGWTCITLLVGQLILSVMVWKLLIELFGRNPLVLAPYVVFSFTPLTLPAFNWLSAAIIWLPLMIAVAGALRWHTRFVRSGRPLDAAVATLWFAVGCASFEKILLFLPYVVLFTLAISPTTELRLRPVLGLVRRTRLVWIGYTAVTAAYLALYLHSSSTTEGTFATAPSPGGLSDFTYLSLLRTFAPGALGGPWSWQEFSYGLGLVGSPRPFDWACWIVAAALIMASLVLRRRASRFWLALLVYLAGSLAIIGVGRVAFIGAVAGLETRYLADAVVPLVVTIAACLMRLRGEEDPWTPTAPRVFAAVRPGQLWTALPLAGVLMIAVSIHSVGDYARVSTKNPARAFTANAVESLRRMPADARLYDTAVPSGILSPFFLEYNSVSRFLAPLVSDEQRRQMYQERASAKPYMMSGDGSLVPMAVAPGVTSRPGQGCLPVKGGTVTVPLTGPAFDWEWAVRIGYLSDTATTGTVSMGKAEQQVTFAKGLGQVFLPLEGSGTTVTISDIPPGVNFCVGDLQVGQPTPSS